MLALVLLLIYSPLGRARRLAARNAAVDFATFAPHIRGEALRRNLAYRLKETPEFGSVIGSLLIGLGIRLAIALIEHWIKNNIIPRAGDFRADEPGA